MANLDEISSSRRNSIDSIIKEIDPDIIMYLIPEIINLFDSKITIQSYHMHAKGCAKDVDTFHIRNILLTIVSMFGPVAEKNEYSIIVDILVILSKIANAIYYNESYISKEIHLTFQNYLEIALQTFLQQDLPHEVKQSLSLTKVPEIIYNTTIENLHKFREITAIAILFTILKYDEIFGPKVNLELKTQEPYIIDLSDNSYTYEKNISSIVQNIAESDIYLCLPTRDAKEITKGRYCKNAIVISNKTRLKQPNKPKNLLWYLTEATEGTYIANADMINTIHVGKGSHNIKILSNAISHIKLFSRNFNGTIDLGSNSSNVIIEAENISKNNNLKFIINRDILGYALAKKNIKSSVVYVSNTTKLNYIMYVSSGTNSLICQQVKKFVYIMPKHSSNNTKIPSYNINNCPYVVIEPGGNITNAQLAFIQYDKYQSYNDNSVTNLYMQGTVYFNTSIFNLLPKSDIKYFVKSNYMEIVLNEKFYKHKILFHNYLTNATQNYQLKMENITLAPSIPGHIDKQQWYIKGELFTQDDNIITSLNFIRNKLNSLVNRKHYYLNTLITINTPNMGKSLNFYYGSDLSDTFLIKNNTYVERGEGSDYYILYGQNHLHDGIVIDNTSYDQALDFLITQEENAQFYLRQDNMDLHIDIKNAYSNYTLIVKYYFTDHGKHLVIKNCKSLPKYRS